MADSTKRLASAAIILALMAAQADGQNAQTIGSQAQNRDFTDSSPGQVFIYAGGHFNASQRVTSFSWFGNGFGGTRVMTPILFEEVSDGVFAVRGVGTGRTVTGSDDVQQFDFALQYGTDVTANDKFTFGFINALVDGSGQRTGSSTGTAEFNLYPQGSGVGGAATTNRWIFTPSRSGLNAALGATYGTPGTTARFALNAPDSGLWNTDRTYAANLASVSTVEPVPPIAPGHDAKVVTCADLFAMADGNYGELFVDGITDANGPIKLGQVVVSNGQVSSVTGGEIRYKGALSALLGNVFTIKSGSQDSGGLRLTVHFQVPHILGGTQAEFQFLVTTGCVLVPVGTRIEIPGTVRREAFTIERAYLDILPEEGKFGGGALIAPDSVTPTFGGWIDLRSGIGPVVDGHATVDVTKIGAGVGHLGAPIGTTGAFLEYVAALIENGNGLSDADNWDKSDLIGQFDIVLGRPVMVGPKEIYAYVFSGNGTWSVHDGSYDFKGTGKLLGAIDTTDVRMRYSPPASITAGGSFDAGIYTGSVTLSQHAGSDLTGKLSGHLGIPGDVPVIGGRSLSSVDASLNGSKLHGSASIEITPAIPEKCIPPKCAYVPPCTTVYGCWDTCKHCKHVPFVGKVCSPPYPCDCHDKKECGAWVCTKKICTPAVPAVKVPFSFTYDVGNSKFDFDVSSRAIDAGTPESGGAFVFLENWHWLEGDSPKSMRTNAKTTGIDPDAGGTAAQQSFTLAQSVPGLIFRTAYGNADVTAVSMQVRTPAGVVLDSSQGALPFGYTDHLGFSRFNAEAFEQVILLVDPIAGTYEVTVQNGDALGDFEITALVQDAPPTGHITSVYAGPEQGQFVVTWEDSDLEGTNTVRIFLDEQRGGNDGFPVATIEPASNVGSYTIDTTNLQIQPGHYFVALVIEDGTNAPVHCVSDNAIEVLPVGRPEPVSRLRVHPEDGGFQLQWSPSPTDNVVGYLVQWREDHEDLGTFDQQLWTREDGSDPTSAFVSGLTNGQPVLVRVVAVGSDQLRSAPSEILRAIPRKWNSGHAPRITSTPDTDATAGYSYMYAPIVEDLDPSEFYVWSLAESPEGMSIDPFSGQLEWLPSADQTGDHGVVVEVTESMPDGNIATASQSFRIHVYPEDQPHGIEAHAYQFMTAPVRDTSEGVTYEYQPVVRGPDENVRFELLAGPEGMIIDPITGTLNWSVPLGAKGEWVRFKAIAGDEHTLEQDFYLFVYREDQFIAQDVEDGTQVEPGDGTPPVCGLACGQGVLPWMAATMLLLTAMRRRVTPVGRSLPVGTINGVPAPKPALASAPGSHAVRRAGGLRESRPNG